MLQAEVDSGVSFELAEDALISTQQRVALSMVLGDEGVDLSEAAGLISVYSRPGFPFGHSCVETRSPLSDPLEDAFGSGFEPGGSVQPLLGLLAVAAPGQAPATAAIFECLLGDPPFVTGPGEVGVARCSSAWSAVTASKGG